MEKEEVLVRSRRSLPIIPVALIAIGICSIIIAFVAIGEGSHYTIYSHEPYWDDEDYMIISVCFAVLIIGIVFYIYSGRCFMVVTDRRVYGKVAFGAQIDLPLDMVSWLPHLLEELNLCMLQMRQKFMLLLMIYW